MTTGLLGSTDPALQAVIGAGMERVEARLRDVVRSSHPMLTEAASHLVEAGGQAGSAAAHPAGRAAR